MSEIQKPELLRQTTISLIDYKTPVDALVRYEGLPLPIKEQMARVYQEAFGGKPWYENCSCPSCGTFEKSTTCSRCGAPDLPPAYPTGELVNEEFPQMLSSFAPGTLVLARNQQSEVIGFCAGGMTTPTDLVVKKYKGNRQIAESIMEQTGLSLTDPLYYENEMCVLPALQGNGVGSALNQARLEWILAQDIGVVLGRTINPNLLKMKERQFPEKGFSMRTFVPNGDSYQVDGLPRQCYFAVRTR
jgi:hypothetical protein